ncbi:YdeI/OmpD-associated family protein [Pedobacter sp. MC2016-15]|uniref:YdeI/OmpD-associated family protein n=1 Tax=Pedobacter sp. MC2016-15 TaxID=2994473 RepID=UPI002247044E|nr:YdeI/OmpD-associated family protein [Pedobacter sp. MC2016-15]
MKNHLSSANVWLKFYKKKSDKHNFTWSAAVDEALCFGWVDSRRKPLDDEKFIQFFCKRKALSTWSEINKAKVANLIETQQMMPAGLTAINIGKENGSWNFLDDIDALVLPADLKLAFEQQSGTLEYYSNLSKSVKKSILQWLKFSKTDKTRKKRIIEIVSAAALQGVPSAIRR